MLKDKNGIELKTGQIVKIEGGYFKADNGYFVIKHSPGDPSWSGNDYCIYKCNKKGIESNSSHACGFFPIIVTVSSREKTKLAREHNKLHSTIEVVGEVPVYKVKVTQLNGWNDYEYHAYLLEKEYKEILENKYCKVELLAA